MKQYKPTAEPHLKIMLGGIAATLYWYRLNDRCRGDLGELSIVRNTLQRVLYMVESLVSDG